MVNDQILYVTSVNDRWENSFPPLYTLATDSVPLVSDFAHQVVQFLRVSRQLSLVSHGLSRPHCRVVNRLL